MDKKAAFGKLKNIPSLRIANRPTPIERCPFLSDAIPSGPRIFIKRDDYIGYLVGGNKVRKLEYVLAEAVRRNATAVVTIGSVQSNHARTTAMAARRLGMKCELILNGEPPDPPCANFLINQKLGIPIHLVDSREEREPRMETVASRLEREGEIVHRIPLGASDSVGALGFVAAFAELLDQEEEMGIRFDDIVISSSSGGTQAGLEVGKRLFDRPELSIIGISPDYPSSHIKQTILEIGRPVIENFDCQTGMADSDIEVDESFVGEGYGLPTEESEEATRLFNRLEAILLDPVYTAKSAAALLSFSRQLRFGRDRNVLFWHTGGLMSLFR